MPYICKKVVRPENIEVERYHHSKRKNDAEEKLRLMLNKNFELEELKKGNSTTNEIRIQNGLEPLMAEEASRKLITL